MSVETDTLLEVKNISVDYLAAQGDIHAVRDVSFTLKRGQILGLAGESGCGKSTLAYAIARLLRPPASVENGEVMYYPPAGARANLNAPVDVLKLPPAQLRKFRWNELAIVFQSAMNALNPVLDIGAQVIDVLRQHRPGTSSDRHKRRAIELFAMVGISADRLHSYPHELSGGMRQRAMIAIALALHPEIIIMDEPTTALDVVVQREILDLVCSICQEMGMALIFITHDLSLLLELADTIAIMYAGKIVELASYEDMYQHQLHPYSFGLLHSFPSLHGPLRRVAGIPGSPPDLRMSPQGCAFHARCPFAFHACRTSTPVLRPSGIERSGSLVACHLYNPAYAGRFPPSSEEFARGYEALASERSTLP